MRLGKRLAAIAGLVPAGSRIADIGTDHAYLPVFLVEGGIVPWAVAGEVNRGPFEAARETIGSAGLAACIDLRLGNGLAVLKPAEVDVVILAGMGGSTMIEILTARPEVVGPLRRLILQPMQAAAALRRWLTNQGWQIAAEDLVEEDGRLYEIIAAEPGQPANLSPVLAEIGPLLWAERHPLLRNHVGHLMAQFRRVVGEMAASQQAAASPKYREYCARLAELEEMYECL